MAKAIQIEAEKRQGKAEKAECAGFLIECVELEENAKKEENERKEKQEMERKQKEEEEEKAKKQKEEEEKRRKEGFFLLKN